MATGTGTEQDPYLVDNLTDFLTCIAIDDAYVKVTADIDAADDPEYNGLIENTIQINCRELYADTNKNINGIIIQAENFITLKGRDTTGNPIKIHDISFTNCKHKLVSNNGKLIYSSGGTATDYNECTRCNFSVQISGSALSAYAIAQTGGSHGNDCGRMSLTRVGVDVTFSGAHGGEIRVLWVESNGLKATYCNFVIRNATDVSIYGANSTNSGSAEMHSCAVIFENANLTGNVIFISSYVPADYSYFALVNPTGTSEITSYRGTQCYACLENAPDTITVNSSYLTQLTPEQLRSRDYLISIGFLP